MSKAIRAGSCTTCLGSLYAHSAEAAINFVFQGTAARQQSFRSRVLRCSVKPSISVCGVFVVHGSIC